MHGDTEKPYLFVLLVRSFGELLFEKHDDLLNVLTRNHLHSNAQGLPPDIEVGAGENAKNFHRQIVQDTFILSAEIVHLVKDYKFDIIVGFRDTQLDQFPGCCLHCNRVACQARQ